MSLASLLQKFRHGSTEAIPEDLYTVVAKNLTLDEIKASNMPDTHLEVTHFELKSTAGRTYSAGHVNRRDDGFISLHAHIPADKLDLEVIAVFVASEAGGSPIRYFDLRGDSEDEFSAAINLKERVTQAKVAEHLEKYSQYFSEVKLDSMFFREVPQSIVDSLNLPREKLNIIPYKTRTHRTNYQTSISQTRSLH